MSQRARELTSPQELQRIARELYIYAYPLVLMEVTRRVSTNTERPRGTRAPMNVIGYMAEFPDASFTEVMRPNADALYSWLWLDVRSEPLVLNVSDSGGRYYMLQMLDMWSDVFAAPGARTSGTAGQVLAITGPGWRGQLPAGVEEIRCATGMAGMLGRTQANGAADFGNVHKFQAGMTAAPLSQWGTTAEVRPGQVDPGQDMSAPVDQVAAMDPARFFALAAALMGANPPHLNDTSMVQRARWLGFRPGVPFDLASAPQAIREAAQAAPAPAWAQINAAIPRTGAGDCGGPVPARSARHRNVTSAVEDLLGAG